MSQKITIQATRVATLLIPGTNNEASEARLHHCPNMTGTKVKSFKTGVLHFG
jgi:hypothetical protein